jgi:hypothetical protein
MWIMFSEGFISAVKHREMPGMLLVRARRPEILKLLFPAKKVQVSNASDYKYRVCIEKEVLAVVMLTKVFDIGYSNFKLSTPDPELAELYGRIWALHQRYQR